MSQVIKILYVEDDVEDQKIFRHFVRQVGLLRYFLECATSLKEARALLAIQDYDLIFVDNLLRNPQACESGLRFIEELAAEGDQTPIVLLTGSGLPHDNETVLEMIRQGRIWFAAKEGLDSEGLENLITSVLKCRSTDQADSSTQKVVSESAA